MQTPQTQATDLCECEDWSKAKPEFGINGQACMQPLMDRKDAPWCYCKKKMETVTWASVNSASLLWSDAKMFTLNPTELPDFHGFFSMGKVTVTARNLAIHKMIQLKYRFYATGTWDNEQVVVLVDGIPVSRFIFQGSSTLCKKGWTEFAGNASGFPVDQKRYSGWKHCFIDGLATVAHTKATAVITFATELNEAMDNEAWGVSGVVVTTSTSAQVPFNSYYSVKDVDFSGYDIASVRVGNSNDPATSLPLSADDCNSMCSTTLGCLAWTYVGTQLRCYMKYNSKEETNWVRAVDVSQLFVSGSPVGPVAPKWAYCNPNLQITTPAVVLEGVTEELSEAWEEKVDPFSMIDLSAGGPPSEPSLPTVECLSGESSTSRENHLGNSRNTANPDPAIPHGLNANRYIWTIPPNIQGNCVVRLRYNISTSDYWAWNNAGTPKTTSDLNAHRRRTQGKSPIVNDPYVGIGEKQEETFLELAINTAQFGRTFQDRSYAFEIRKRPADVPATAKIYNLNVRGKRGNIVQTFPAVEYDFIPNDLCINQNDYVHMQWTGSDYNPQNDGEGAGDCPPGDPNQQSRADRSNIVDMDTIPMGLAHPSDKETPDQFGPRSTWQSGAGQHYAEVAAGMYYPAGSLNHWSKLNTEYTGMFWTADGKPDTPTMMKMAFLNQVAGLGVKGKKCKTIAELKQIPNQAARERDPENCGKLNAASDAKGNPTPYFDGGLIQMRKAGKFSYMSSRNNNFSNRNQAGFICIKGATSTVGMCAIDKNCETTVMDDLKAMQISEDASGAKKLALIEETTPLSLDAAEKAAQMLLDLMPLGKAEEVLRALASKRPEL